MRTRKIKVPATTNNITTGIINRLLVDGHSASRINIQGQFTPIPQGDVVYFNRSSLRAELSRKGLLIGRFQKSGARKGVADILCCMRPSGSFLAIEIKNALTEDKVRPDQLAYMEEIKKAGGDYWIVTSFDEFIQRYEASRWSY